MFRDAGGGPMNDMVAALAADLRELRRESGSPSYADLARKTGVPRSTLHDALRGQRLPSLETTLAVAAVCGGDPVVWKRRWMATRAAVEENGRAAPAKPVRTDEETAAPDVPERRRIRWPAIVVAAAVLVATGVAGVLFLHPFASCSPVREYRVDAAGAVLNATGTPIGDVATGDTLDVASLAHDRYPHRYFGTVRRTGVHGYVDEAKLTFVKETCV